MKRIWLFCLCLASLNLVGCFHIPDEDWLPSKNKVDTWNIQEDIEMQQAVDSLMEWFNIISAQRDEMKKGEDDVIYTGDFETTETWEIIDNENIISNESVNQKIEETSEK